MTVDQVSSELAIRNLVARTADAVTNRDLETFGKMWAADAVWTVGDNQAKGVERIVQFLSGAFERLPAIVQVAQAGFITHLAGDKAGGIWPVLELQSASDGKETMLVGRYEDHYIRIDGEWFFSARSFTPIYRGPLAPGLTEYV